MAQRCKKCGSFLTDTDRFCPNCGENISQPAQPQTGTMPTQSGTVPTQSGTVPTQPLYQTQSVPQSGMGMPPPPVYPVPPVRPQYEEEMTLGKWVLTLFVTNFLGIISWVFLFVWGFGSGPVSRSSYCKAMLIVKAVGVAVAIVFIALYASVLIPLIAEYAEYGDYGDYTYAAAAVFPGFFG